MRKFIKFVGVIGITQLLILGLFVSPTLAAPISNGKVIEEKVEITSTYSRYVTVRVEFLSTHYGPFPETYDYNEYGYSGTLKEVSRKRLKSGSYEVKYGGYVYCSGTCMMNSKKVIN